MSESDWQETVEPIVYPGRIKVPYNWSVGETGSKFFLGINEDKIIKLLKMIK